MKRRYKIFILIIFITGLFSFWYLAEDADYFQANYRELSIKQQEIFKWQDDDDGAQLIERYRKAFADSQYAFPRQKVAKIKLFHNQQLASGLTSKTLKQKEIKDFIKFCNDTSNFGWAETTWDKSESEYFCRMYNNNEEVIGKIYFCVEHCRMTRSIPFSPMMKFGELSEKGMEYLGNLISDKTKWE